MLENKKNKKNKKKKSAWSKNKLPASQIPTSIIVTLVILLLTSLAIITFVFLFDNSYQGRMYPGTMIGDIDVGGLSYEVSRNMVEERVNKVLDQGLNFIYDDQKFTIKSVVGDLVNPELSSELFSYNIDKTIDEIILINKKRNQAERIFYWLSGWKIFPILQVDQEKLTEVLSEEISQYEQPAVEAALKISEEYDLTIDPEKGGQAFNYDKIIEEIKNNLKVFSTTPITLALEKDTPQITKTRAELVLSLVKQSLSTAPYTLVYNELSWEVDKKQLREWLMFTVVNGEVSIGLHKDKLAEYLALVANEIDIEAKEAKFKMENGKVSEFQLSQNGLKMDIAKSAELFNDKIRKIGIKEINLVVAEDEPIIKTSEVSELNDMGIKELIGEGRSNFAGSPSNRRHNIALGAASVNGTLIAPGETFSLIKTLGNIDKAGGYLPELVIKGNKTIPEYGGGLCQIGTTTFRAVLNAGLDIIERKNHSYRVSYYEPAGTDATIYDPSPDFKFINDTKNYVLFNTEIVGDEVIFRIYGTNDGRQIEQTYPRIYNIVQPGPTKLIETTDLAPGVKKCTESAHAGADAEFTHTITYPDGQKKVDVYKSHYKPWQAVCLIGVEEVAEDITIIE